MVLYVLLKKATLKICYDCIWLQNAILVQTFVLYQRKFICGVVRRNLPSSPSRYIRENAENKKNVFAKHAQKDALST